MFEPRLKETDLVKVRRAVTFKHMKLSVKDIGILLEINIVNGFATGKVFWQNTQKYTDDIPTQYLVKVES